MSTAKKMSIKSIEANIDKIKADIEKKKNTIETLKEEIKTSEAKLKEYIAEKEEIQREQVFNQIKTNLGNSNMSADKLNKLSDVITMITKEKLDTEEVMTAISMVLDEKKQDGKLS